MNSRAMQRGGVGLILTTLILTAPPMAAAFLQGTLRGFMAYSQIGGSPAAEPGPQGQLPGSYTPPQKNNTSNATGGDSGAQLGRTMGASQPIVSDSNSTGKYGNAAS